MRNSCESHFLAFDHHHNATAQIEDAALALLVSVAAVADLAQQLKWAQNLFAQTSQGRRGKKIEEFLLKETFLVLLVVVCECTSAIVNCLSAFLVKEKMTHFEFYEESAKLATKTFIFPPLSLVIGLRCNLAGVASRAI